MQANIIKRRKSEIDSDATNRPEWQSETGKVIQFRGGDEIEEDTESLLS